MFLSLFKRAWKGEASLAAAFWIIYVLIGYFALQGIVSWLVGYFMPALSMHVDNPTPEMLAASMKQSFLILAICLPYMLYSAICIWRCGRNSWGLWRFLSRLIVLISIVIGLASIYFLIAGGPNLPNMVKPTPAVTQEAAA